MNLLENVNCKLQQIAGDLEDKIDKRLEKTVSKFQSRSPPSKVEVGEMITMTRATSCGGKQGWVHEEIPEKEPVEKYKSKERRSYVLLSSNTSLSYQEKWFGIELQGEDVAFCVRDVESLVEMCNWITIPCVKLKPKDSVSSVCKLEIPYDKEIHCMLISVLEKSRIPPLSCSDWNREDNCYRSNNSKNEIYQPQVSIPEHLAVTINSGKRTLICFRTKKDAEIFDDEIDASTLIGPNIREIGTYRTFRYKNLKVSGYLDCPALKSAVALFLVFYQQRGRYERV